MWQELTSQLTDTPWTAIQETTIANANVPHANAAHAGRQPDGILHNPSTNTWILYDFTRTSGYTSNDLHAAHDRKLETYADLMQDLRTTSLNATFLFFPIVASFTGAIEEVVWTEAFQTPFAPPNPKVVRKIMITGMTQLLVGTDTMATTRHKAKKIEPPQHASRP